MCNIVTQSLSSSSDDDSAPLRHLRQPRRLRPPPTIPTPPATPNSSFLIANWVIPILAFRPTLTPPTLPTTPPPNS